MIYRLAWMFLGVLIVGGLVYLGTVGITVTKRPVQTEIPARAFVQTEAKHSES